jgi:serine O-acetyltransferase
MDMERWMNTALPFVVNRLTESITRSYHVETSDHLGSAGRRSIYEMHDSLLSILFPGRYSSEEVSNEDVNFFLNDILRHVAFKFQKQLYDAFHIRCRARAQDCEDCDCREQSELALVHLINRLPKIREVLLEDIRAAYEGDPAASSLDEIVLSYPCLDAIATYRLAHTLYERKVPIIPRIISERAHADTGIDIHPGAEIGPGFFIDHGTGVVIGETCKIGSNVKIYQGVTLGALSPFDREGRPRKGQKRHPNIEDDVIIYANATILGGETVIGKGSIIGGNTWIVSSVPPGTVIYSNSDRR